MRTCPKCRHKSSDRAEYCEGCGYLIVLHPSRKTPPPCPRRPRVRAVAAPKPFPDWSLDDVCRAHGLDCDPVTCTLRDDLIESGIL